MTGNGSIAPTYDFVYDIPLILSLKQLLANSFIFEEVINIVLQLIQAQLGNERSQKK